MSKIIKSYGTMLILFLVGCGQENNKGGLAVPPAGFTADAKQGGQLFKENCARCHGVEGKGTNQGPPLVHIIYEPSHHSDLAFYMAIQNGVQSHHWQFGNMPSIPGVNPEQAGHIVAYIRMEQQKAGIK